MVVDNICFVLNSFLRCSAFESVVFCWVMQTPDIVQQVLGRLPAGLFSPRLITLMASPEALAARVQKDVDARLRGADALARALCYREKYAWSPCTVDTTHLSPGRRAGGAAIGKKAARPRPWAC